VLQRVAVCCGVSLCVAELKTSIGFDDSVKNGALQCVAACCSVLRCVEVRDGVENFNRI